MKIYQIKYTKLININYFQHRINSINVDEFQNHFNLYNNPNNVIINKLLKHYRSISPLLIMIEQHVCITETGNAAELYDYYKYWEQEILNALIYMTISSMHDFQLILNDQIQFLLLLIVIKIIIIIKLNHYYML